MSEKKEPTGRALARKMYKILKRKRAKAKKAQAKAQTKAVPQEAVPIDPTKWTRVLRGDSCPKATNRPVDNIEEIEKLLMKRSKAKLEKNYAVADKIAAKLISSEIYYNEDKKEWHTRVLLTHDQKEQKERQRQAKRDRDPETQPGVDASVPKKQKKDKKKESKKKKKDA